MTRFLFVKSSLQFPRVSGHDLHCYEMMRHLSLAGHEIHLLTKHATENSATAYADLKTVENIETLPAPNNIPLDPTYLQSRFQSYWGISSGDIKKVAYHAEQVDADAVVAVGLDVLPYLNSVRNGRKKVWYAADEWVYHHLSRLFVSKPNTWRNIRSAAIKGLYEYAYSNRLDLAWFVSGDDVKWGRRILPNVRCICIPNGVDHEHYKPSNNVSEPHTCTFWGRLDFGPNIDAIRWFVNNVWTKNSDRLGIAKFNIYGAKPTKEMLELRSIPGITLTADLPDLRSEIAKQSVVVLPFISGGGIKNKLLEAAAMGKAIIASKVAIRGISLPDPLPLITSQETHEWTASLVDLWNDSATRNQLGDSAYNWVSRDYTWDAAAKMAADSVIPVNRSSAKYS